MSFSGTWGTLPNLPFPTPYPQIIVPPFPPPTPTSLHVPILSPQSKSVTCISMGVLECLIMHPGKLCQPAVSVQSVYFSKNRLKILCLEPVSKCTSLTLMQFPRSLLETANLGQNVVLYLGINTLQYIKVTYLCPCCCKRGALKNVSKQDLVTLVCVGDDLPQGFAHFCA